MVCFGAWQVGERRYNLIDTAFAMLFQYNWINANTPWLSLYGMLLEEEWRCPAGVCHAREEGGLSLLLGDGSVPSFARSNLAPFTPPPDFRGCNIIMSRLFPVYCLCLFLFIVIIWTHDMAGTGGYGAVAAWRVNGKIGWIMRRNDEDDELNDEFEDEGDDWEEEDDGLEEEEEEDDDAEWEEEEDGMDANETEITRASSIAAPPSSVASTPVVSNASVIATGEASGENGTSFSDVKDGNNATFGVLNETKESNTTLEASMNDTGKENVGANSGINDESKKRLGLADQSTTSVSKFNDSETNATLSNQSSSNAMAAANAREEAKKTAILNMLLNDEEENEDDFGPAQTAAAKDKVELVKIILYGTNDNYLSRCEACGPKFSHLFTKAPVDYAEMLRMGNPGRTEVWRVETVQRLDENRTMVRFLSDSGRYLQRLDQPFTMDEQTCYHLGVDALSPKESGLLWTVNRDFPRDRKVVHITADNGMFLRQVAFSRWSSSRAVAVVCPDPGRVGIFGYLPVDPATISAGASNAPFLFSENRIAPFGNGDAIRLEPTREWESIQWAPDYSASHYWSGHAPEYASNATNLLVRGLLDFSYHEAFYGFYIGDPREGIVRLKTFDNRWVSRAPVDPNCTNCPWRQSSLLRFGKFNDNATWKLAFNAVNNTWTFQAWSTDANAVVPGSFCTIEDTTARVKPLTFGNCNNPMAFHVELLQPGIVDKMKTSMAMDYGDRNVTSNAPPKMNAPSTEVVSQLFSDTLNQLPVYPVGLNWSPQYTRTILPESTNRTMLGEALNVSTVASNASMTWNLTLVSNRSGEMQVTLNHPQYHPSVYPTQRYRSNLASLYPIFDGSVDAAPQTYRLIVTGQGTNHPFFPGKNTKWFTAYLEHTEWRGWYLSMCPTTCGWIENRIPRPLGTWDLYSVMTLMRNSDIDGMDVLEWLFVYSIE